MEKLLFLHLAEKVCDMDELNDFEIALLKRVSLKHPSIKNHLPFLRVSSRKFTGVGMYVNFYYLTSNCKIPDLDILNGVMGINEQIKIEGLVYGLGYEIDVTDGLIRFIELITYGEEWNGLINDYSFPKL
jgi:hypothetical protein